MAKRIPIRGEPTRKLAVEMARLAHDNRCEDIVLLDLRDRSPVTDFFLIATGTSDRQMRSVADDLAKLGKQQGTPAWHVSGLEGADWVLLDFVDLVVHLFDAERRSYYDLELLWGDAPRVSWRRRATRKTEPAEPPPEES